MTMGPQRWGIRIENPKRKFGYQQDYTVSEKVDQKKILSVNKKIEVELSLSA